MSSLLYLWRLMEKVVVCGLFTIDGSLCRFSVQLTVQTCWMHIEAIRDSKDLGLPRGPAACPDGPVTLWGLHPELEVWDGPIMLLLFSFFHILLLS